MGKQNKKCLGQMQTKYIMISHTRIVKIAKKVGQKNKSYNMFNRSIVFTGEKGLRPHGI